MQLRPQPSLELVIMVRAHTRGARSGSVSTPTKTPGRSRTALWLGMLSSLFAVATAAAQTPAAAVPPTPISPGHELDAAELHRRCRPLVGEAMEPRAPRHHRAGGETTTRLAPPPLMDPLHQACVNELAAREAAKAATPAPKQRQATDGAPRR